MSKLHWIGMAGLHGCILSTCNSYETANDAADALADLHEIGKNRRAKLKRDRYLELNPVRDGNEYCKIVSCDCDNPDQHKDN